MNLRYTQHAFDRMHARGISRSMIEAVVISGKMEVQRGVARRYTLEGLVVVVDGEDVVTTYFNRGSAHKSSWGPKKRQRLCRPKKHRPTWIPGRVKINISLAHEYLRQMEARA